MTVSSLFRVACAATSIAAGLAVAGCGSSGGTAAVVAPADAGAPTVVVLPAVPGGAAAPRVVQPTPVAQLPVGGGVAAASTLPHDAQRGAAPGAQTVGSGATGGVSGSTTGSAAAASSPLTLLQGLQNAGGKLALGALTTLGTLSNLVNTLLGKH
jgi:hypothetical protein